MLPGPALLLTALVFSAAAAPLAGQASSDTAGAADGRPRWLPRYVSLGLGGVAATTPDGGAVRTPAFGGALDVAAIGRLRGGFAWRAEGFLQSQDRRDPAEVSLRADRRGDGEGPCLPPTCADGPVEFSRRTGGLAIGVEHHARPGRAGPYLLALVGVASTTSFGSGTTVGLAPSVGLGFLSPLDHDLDGFALEARWRRIPSALGAVDTGVLSVVLRF